MQAASVESLVFIHKGALLYREKINNNQMITEVPPARQSVKKFAIIATIKPRAKVSIQREQIFVLGQVKGALYS